MKNVKSSKSFPVAACQSCGGWTKHGGMSHKADGAEGCVCTPCQSIERSVPIAKGARVALAAACSLCGGWTQHGGMSHKADGAEGCDCRKNGRISRG